jgi:uncharacterized protein (TIGR03067 family)
VRRDIDRLQGTWDIVELEIEGQKMPAGASQGSRIVINGDRFTTVSMGASYEGAVELDGSKRPRTIDLIFTDGPEKGNRSLGIYELKRDTWKLCLTLTGKVRPKEFATSPKSGLALETLKRAGTDEGPTMSALPGDPVPELEGEWTMVSCVRDGVPLDEAMVRYGKRVDAHNEVKVSFGPQVIFKAKYTAQSGQDPKTIDFHSAGGLQLGIYELSGETLRVCYGAPGQARPEGYDTAPGDGRTMAVWKRISP